MSIRRRIRRWLGITEIQEDQALIHRELKGLGSLQKRVLDQMNVITPGLGRVIAKLDANYARDDHDPAKRAESDEIADETIERLRAEAAAREPYNHG